MGLVCDAQVFRSKLKLRGSTFQHVRRGAFILRYAHYAADVCVCAKGCIPDMLKLRGVCQAANVRARACVYVCVTWTGHHRWLLRARFTRIGWPPVLLYRQRGVIGPRRLWGRFGVGTGDRFCGALSR